MTIELAEIELPEFGLPTIEPVLPKETYLARLQMASRRGQDSGCDFLLVYGDREHFANLTYLSGYDPRFEEALLILRPGQLPTLLIGNEGMGYSTLLTVEVQRILYQSFSLLGHP